MENSADQIKALQEKLDSLLRRQEDFSKEIKELKDAITALSETPQASESMGQESAQSLPEPEPEPTPAPEPVAEPVQATPEAPTASMERATTYPRKFRRRHSGKILGGVASGLAEYWGMNVALMRFLWVLITLFYCIGPLVYVILWATIPSQPRYARPTPSPAEAPSTGPRPTPAAATPVEPVRPSTDPSQRAFNLEKYIGENLISKIGIVILIIGVGLGVKYSIDNDLIGPTVRILLGYAIGLSLVGLSWKLKPKYRAFSAVLLSGALAMMYFVTFAAYAFYDLFPQWAAFALMVVYTIATVYSALHYNHQIIAHIGLVGAYGVPFLLHDGKDQPAIFFSYIAIINIGILAIAIRKYWKPLYGAAFGLTWLIFLTWYATGYEYENHARIAWVFLILFFLIFYSTFLAYKIRKKERFGPEDVVLLLSNAFLFYAFGYALMDGTEGGESQLGMFTLINALPHALVSYLLYRMKAADTHMVRLVTGLGLVFLTLSIPVQLDGNWVTLLWIGEATLLFWIGRSKGAAFYERLSYPLIAVSFLSLTHDWLEAVQVSYQLSEAVSTPFLNSTFLTSLLYAGAVAGMLYLLRTLPKEAETALEHSIQSALAIALPALLLLVAYVPISVEIEVYWNQLEALQDNWEAAGTYQQRADIYSFRALWQLMYSFVFLSVLGLANHRFWKSRLLGGVQLLLSAGALFAFLTLGLYQLSELRDSYQEALAYGEHTATGFHLGIRYVSLLLLALLFFVGVKVLRSPYMAPVPKEGKRALDITLALATGWVLTSELLHWLDLAGVENTYKLWVSILWGSYALALVVLGIWKKQQHLRIAAIALFSLTLLKLFLYDIAHLNGISKTIVFFTLGILLLIVSYLYNRFKHKISEDEP